MFVKLTFNNYNGTICCFHFKVNKNIPCLETGLEVKTLQALKLCIKKKKICPC